MTRLHTRWIIYAVTSILFLGLGGMPPDQDSEKSILASGEVHDGWYFAAGQTVLIEGTVNGDVYAAGGEVEITGTVNGDVLAAGGTVTVSGTVAEDVRAAGGTVRISGSVDGNCTLAGGTVVIASDGVVKDNVLIMGGSIRVSGKTEKELKVFCDELVLSGSVGRDLQFGGEQIEITPGATVAGDATIDLGEMDKALIAEGTVRGETHIRVGEDRPESAMFGDGSGSLLFNILYGLSLVLMAALLVFVLPGRTVEGRALLRDSFGMTFLWGFLGLIVVPLAAVVLMIVVVGIPLALFVLVLYFWFLYLSQLSLPLLASCWMTRADTARGWKLFWPVAVGVIVLLALMLIPYLDFLLWLVGAILGMGVFLRLVSSSLSVASKA